MKQLNRCPVWLAGVFTILVASAAPGGDVLLTCPAEASVGGSLWVNTSFENYRCSAVEVRLMSGIVGNASGTLAGLGVYGPVVAVPLMVVPAGSQRWCQCSANLCGCDYGPTGSQLSCTTDADCPTCGASIPGTQNAFFDSEVAFPAELSGTVATQVIISEIDSGFEVETKINECFVEVL